MDVDGDGANLEGSSCVSDPVYILHATCQSGPGPILQGDSLQCMSGPFTEGIHYSNRNHVCDLCYQKTSESWSRTRTASHQVLYTNRTK